MVSVAGHESANSGSSSRMGSLLIANATVHTSFWSYSVGRFLEKYIYLPIASPWTTTILPNGDLVKVLPVAFMASTGLVRLGCGTTVQHHRPSLHRLNTAPVTTTICRCPSYHQPGPHHHSSSPPPTPTSALKFPAKSSTVLFSSRP